MQFGANKNFRFAILWSIILKTNKRFVSAYAMTAEIQKRKTDFAGSKVNLES
jgi:hypothetical protein